MRIGVPKEIVPGETRIAASPDSIKKFTALGVEVLVESGAGDGAQMSDEVLAEAGANIVVGAKAVYSDADLVTKVRAPLCDGNAADELSLLNPDTVLVGLLAPLQQREQVSRYAALGVTSFAMELIPRISRAQSMDALSSQSNIAGYKAVIDAADHFGRILPMMMTAAGTVAPARVLVLGAGRRRTSGDRDGQAPRRIGFGVRRAPRRQRAGREPWRKVHLRGRRRWRCRDRERLRQGDGRRIQAAARPRSSTRLSRSRTSASRPRRFRGKPAPELITEAMVKDMKPGSVIVDLAVETGGNCALSAYDQVVERHGVTIVGHANYPARVPVDTSTLYARNLFNFIQPMINQESHALEIDWEDEVIRGALLTKGGAVVNPALQGRGDVAVENVLELHPLVIAVTMFRARSVHRLLRGVERDASAAHATDVGHERHFQCDHRGRTVGSDAGRGQCHRQDFRRHRRRPSGGQHIRRIHGHPANALDVQEEEIRQRFP